MRRLWPAWPFRLDRGIILGLTRQARRFRLQRLFPSFPIPDRPQASSVNKPTATVRKTKAASKAAIKAAITGVHGYLPPDVLTNAELAQMVDTSDEWIVERTGIKERHILKGKGLGTSHMGAQAVAALLAKTKTAPHEVDLLICATTTPRRASPGFEIASTSRPAIVSLRASSSGAGTST